MIDVLAALAALASVLVPWLVYLAGWAGVLGLACGSVAALFYAPIEYHHDDDPNAWKHTVVLAGLLAVAFIVTGALLPTLRTYLAI